MKIPPGHLRDLRPALPRRARPDGRALRASAASCSTDSELDGESWQTPAHSTGQAEELLAASAEHGLEGIVVKRLDSRYAPGKRNGAWLKVKNVGRQEFVIGGWVAGRGAPRDRLGSILRRLLRRRRTASCATRAKSAPASRERDLRGARRAVGAARARRRAPSTAARPAASARFVEPELVAEIEFRELTAEGMVRHGCFKGLRDDKPAAEVALERSLARLGDRGS